MAKSTPEYVTDFLLELLPGLLPKPLDSVAKSAVATFKDQLDTLLKQPRLQRELLEAARNAENDFRIRAKQELGNDELTQRVASLPLHDRELFQRSLQSLPEYLNEDILADHLQRYISDDWKGDFTPEELRKGTAIYLNCLKVRLLNVEGFGDLIARLEVLRTGERTEQILGIVKELLELVRLLIEQMKVKESVVAALFTIPQPVQDFTGREQELEQLKASFQAGVLITGLSGGGGVGKTELARKLAHEIADAYPSARLSIDLLGTSENPLAPEEVMRRLLEPFYPNQKLPDDPQGLKGLYQQTFASNKALLLLDNAANETQVRPLIPPQPSAAIVTSRKHFSLSEFGLNPLRLDVLSPEEARDLLRNASSKLRDAGDADLDALAAQCGRLPLALRVAASLLNDRDDWTLTTLQKRLADERTRLARLKREGDLDLDVEATLSLSYDLLDGDLKKKFRGLGLFTAPFIRLSAGAVWELEDETEADDLLGKLINLSLLSTSPSPLGEGAGGGVLYSYTLHDLTRVFAMDKLLEDLAEAKATAMRHASHFLEWGSAADNLYEKGNENILLGLAQFRFIYPHLQTAYERLSPENKTFPRPDNADRWLSDFPGKCAYVLDLHLPPRQKIILMETALSAALRLGDKNAEGVHLGNLGLDYADLGDAKKAIEFYEQALVIVREIGDRRGEGIHLGNLGNAYAALGDAKKAIEFHEQQLVIVREIGYRRGEGNALGSLGLAYADLGDAKKAIEFYEQQLVIVREIGDRRGEGAALGNLGLAYAALGDAKKAIEFHEQQLVIVREIGDRRGEGADLGNLGNAYAALGDAKKAIEFYEAQLVIVREIGDRRGEGNALGNLGIAYKNLGDAKKAIEFYEQALVIDREIDDRRGEGADLANLGMAHKNLGDREKARDLWSQALEIFRAIEDPNMVRVEKWLAEMDGDLGEKKEVTIQDFVRAVIQAHRSKSPQAGQLFDTLGKMIGDTNAPPEIQELAKVLRRVMSGVKEPDLSNLPEELANLVREELAQKE